MCFQIFQNEKTLFQAIKTRTSKSGKIAIFPKGLVHGFGQKVTIFPSFFFGNTGQENVFYDILERKNLFLSYKNKKFKKSKNCHFFQRGQSMVLVKNWPFFHVFLKVIQARKMCFTIFQNEKTPFQAIKTRSSKRGKIAIFPKRLVYGFGQKLAIFPSFFFKAIKASKMCFSIF